MASFLNIGREERPVDMVLRERRRREMRPGFVRVGPRGQGVPLQTAGEFLDAPEPREPRPLIQRMADATPEGPTVGRGPLDIKPGDFVGAEAEAGVTPAGTGRRIAKFGGASFMTPEEVRRQEVIEEAGRTPGDIAANRAAIEARNRMLAERETDRALQREEIAGRTAVAAEEASGEIGAAEAKAAALAEQTAAERTLERERMANDITKSMMGDEAAMARTVEAGRSAGANNDVNRLGTMISQITEAALKVNADPLSEVQVDVGQEVQKAIQAFNEGREGIRGDTTTPDRNGDGTVTGQEQDIAAAQEVMKRIREAYPDMKPQDADVTLDAADLQKYRKAQRVLKAV